MSDNSVLEKVTQAQHQFLSYLDRAVTPTTETVRRASEVLERYLPQSPFTQSERLPSVSEVIDSQFDFGVALLQRQRKLLYAVIEGASAVSAKLTPVEDPAAEAA